jgi:hypothetical protein
VGAPSARAFTPDALSWLGVGDGRLSRMMAAAQSTFVTVVAWLAVLLSGFAALSSLPVVFMAPMLFPPGEIPASELAQMPPSARFMFQNMMWIAGLQVLVWFATLAFSIGLLKRREWGRVGFIAVLLVMIFSIIAMAVFQNQMLAEMFAGVEEAPADAASFLLVMRAAFVLFPLALLSLLGFLAYKLNSPSIRAEFS